MSVARPDQQVLGRAVEIIGQLSDPNTHPQRHPQNQQSNLDQGANYAAQPQNAEELQRREEKAAEPLEQQRDAATQQPDDAAEAHIDVNNDQLGNLGDDQHLSGRTP